MDVDRTSWGSTLVKNHDENKTYILVKLSESFSNAIQEYSAPRIKFHGSRGAIKFPNGKSYDFSLAQSDNPIECIRQTKNRWESVGRTTCCLHIKGKDDVYQRTRTKMEAAEQEKRKYCTKLLGSPDSANSASSATTATTLAPTTLATTTATSTRNNHFNHSSSSINAILAGSTNTSNHNQNHNHNYSHNHITANNTNSNSTNNINSTTNNNSNNISNNNNNHCILSKYPDITDIKQLKRYKAEFDKDLKEYQNLHGYLQKIEEKFRRSKDIMDQYARGTPEHEAAKDEIFRVHEKIDGDSNFHKARSKYKQVYTKLVHIKEKIFQYKSSERELRGLSTRKKRKREDPNH